MEEHDSLLTFEQLTINPGPGPRLDDLVLPPEIRKTIQLVAHAYPVRRRILAEMEEVAQHVETDASEKAEALPLVGWAVAIVKTAKDAVDHLFAARHSKAHRAAQNDVINAAQKDMSLWVKGIDAEVEAAKSVSDLRKIGRGQVLPSHEAVKNEVEVVQEIQAWVLALESRSKSYTSKEKMDLLREERKGLGESLSDGESE